jgi:hypothetical protein
MTSKKKYKKEIKSMLNNVVGEDLGKKIFDANFPEPTKEEKEHAKKQRNFDKATYLLNKMMQGKKLTKEQKKELKKLTGLET